MFGFIDVIVLLCFLLCVPLTTPLATPTLTLSQSRTNYINPAIQERYPLAFLPKLTRPASVPKSSPPPSEVVQIPNFLTPEECGRLIGLGEAVALTGQECEEYLNARVNEEISEKGVSLEASELISEHMDDSCAIDINESAGGGYRVRLGEDDIRDALEEKVKFIMGLEDRTEGFYFEEGAWERPTPRRIVIRDQTMVKYSESNGVPPHVDGKDATLLIYLNTVDAKHGGRTVFVEDGLAVAPVQGTALLYKSQTELLHFSEPVKSKEGTKYILQLLIDYEHDYKKGETVTDFRKGTSYVC
mmetsp:Transcript_23989/g.45146  ORF Transcript_23989/g.45146 Transcript_23989/m.45146 type:complete len:301 (-) Transcript_23989:44-946(-)